MGNNGEELERLPRGAPPALLPLGIDLPTRPRLLYEARLSPKRFSVSLGKIRDDLRSKFLCSLRIRTISDGRRTCFENFKTELAELGPALAAYLAADISQALERVLRPLPSPLAPHIELPVGSQITQSQLQAAARQQAAQRVGRQLVRELALELEQALAAHILAFEPTDFTKQAPYLGSLVGGQILGPVADIVDKVEGALMPEVTELSVASEGLAADSRDEYADWFLLVRHCLATLFVQGLAYRNVWGDPFKIMCSGNQVSEEGIYGTAGYWLAAQVPGLADVVRVSVSNRSLEARLNAHRWMAAYFSLSADVATGTQFGLVSSLREMSFAPLAWRDWCSNHPAGEAKGPKQGMAGGPPVCGPNDKGEHFPWMFNLIPPEVHNNPIEEVGPMPDHLFARPVGITRIDMVRHHWNLIKATMPGLAVDKKVDERHRDLEFHITASTLQFGGQHPPHQAHRNGCMFDVVVRAVLPLTCAQPAQVAAGGPMIVEEQILAGGPAGAGNQSLVIFIDEPPEESVSEGCVKWVYPKRKITYDGGNKEITPDVLGLKFTQCVLLTFPSQVILASWETLRDALNKLIDKATALKAKQQSKEDKASADHLLEYLGARAPKDKPEKCFGVLCLIEGHHDHWHVSYLPSILEQPPKGRPEAQRWVEAHFQDLMGD